MAFYDNDLKWPCSFTPLAGSMPNPTCMIHTMSPSCPKQTGGVSSCSCVIRLSKWQQPSVVNVVLLGVKQEWGVIGRGEKRKESHTETCLNSCRTFLPWIESNKQSIWLALLRCTPTFSPSFLADAAGCRTGACPRWPRFLSQPWRLGGKAWRDCESMGQQGSVADPMGRHKIFLLLSDCLE